MVTTRDQVEAYTYESRRQVTSLMLGADEAVTDPRRRLNRSTIGGTVIAVLLIAGFLGGGRSARVIPVPAGRWRD